MADFIVMTLGSIDAGVSNYAQSVFTGVGGAVQSIIVAAGLVALPILAINAMVQLRPMQMGTFVTWFIRYVIVLSVATSWAQFDPIYRILTEVPNNYGGRLLSASGFGGGSSGLNEAMDQMVTGVFDFADVLNDNSSILGISITGVVMTVLGSIMAAVAIIVSGIGKIGLAMAVSLAPLMIAMMMFRGTSQLFESWSRFTLGFALIPLVLAGIMGTIIGIGTPLISSAAGAGSLSDAAGFLIVVVAAIFLMYQIPTLVTGLAGSIVATAGAALVAAGAGTAVGTAVGGGSRLAASSREVGVARDAGGSRFDVAKARIAGLRQNTFQRDARREQVRLDRLGNNGDRNGPSGAERAAASVASRSSNLSSSSQSSLARNSAQLSNRL